MPHLGDDPVARRRRSDRRQRPSSSVRPQPESCPTCLWVAPIVAIDGGQQPQRRPGGPSGSPKPLVFSMPPVGDDPVARRRRAPECISAGLLGWKTKTKTKTINHQTAIFRQVNKDKFAAHHDALEFPDGRTVLLTHLCEGQAATVLQLPAQPATAAEADAQKRVTYVG